MTSHSNLGKDVEVHMHQAIHCTFHYCHVRNMKKSTAVYIFLKTITVFCPLKRKKSASEIENMALGRRVNDEAKENSIIS